MGKKVQKAICIFGAEFMLEQINCLEDEFEGAFIGEDIEHIHRLRVSSRRLRNGLKHFKDCLPSKKTKRWQDEISRVTHALGNARDLDIQIALLNHLNDHSLNPNYTPGYERLLLRLKQRRNKAQTKVNQSISKLQEGKILQKMCTRLEKLSTISGGAYTYTPSLYQRAFSAINKALDDFLSYQQYIWSPDNIDKLHAMRIAGKQLRYTLEIFAPIYDQALIPFVRVMKDLQDQLGAIHDNDVWVSWLPKFIDKEQSRIEDYFGNTDPLEKLLPGIHNLIKVRQKAREDEYQSFLATWENLQYENAWETIREVIEAPINLGAPV